VRYVWFVHRNQLLLVKYLLKNGHYAACGRDMLLSLLLGGQLKTAMKTVSNTWRHVAGFVLTLCLLCASVVAQDKGRLEDELLLAVGRDQLRQDPDVRCVRGPNPRPARVQYRIGCFNDFAANDGPFSRCSGDWSPQELASELWLGPVVWRQPYVSAAGYFGPPAPAVVGRRAFYADRGRWGRWRFTEMVRE
jgi:hypothetical protein